MKPPNDLKRCQQILLALTDPRITDSQMTPEQSRWCGRAWRVMKEVFLVRRRDGVWVLPRGAGCKR